MTASKAWRAAAGAALALALAAPAARAQTWYTVEVLAFARLAPDAGTEYWPPDPGRPEDEGAISLLDPGALAIEGEPDAGATLAFARLPGDALALTAIRRQLARSAGYRPLLHVAWRQPGLGRASARRVRLPPPAEPDGGPWVDGILRLHRARYLHLEADLLLHLGPPGSPPAGDGSARVFRLSESRRMRSGKLHYLDHPRFGLLVLTTPYAPPEPVAEPPAAESPDPAPEAPATGETPPS